MLSAPHLCVLIPEKAGVFGADGFVYLPCLLSQSIHLLEQRSEICIPEDLPELAAKGYDQDAAPQEGLTLWMEHLMDEQVKAAAGGVYEILLPEKGFFPSPQRNGYSLTIWSGAAIYRPRHGWGSRPFGSRCCRRPGISSSGSGHRWQESA